MGESDRQSLETPFYGSRRMKAWLERRGMRVSQKRVQRLMRATGPRAIYQRPGTSRRSSEHPVYPYLLRNIGITRPNQVWAADITYLPMAPRDPLPSGGDGLAQPVRAGLSAVQRPGGGFCAEALEEALGQGQPEVFNTDQGSQFTSLEFTQVLQERGVKISMDGKGRNQDNIFVERLWRTVMYEEVYLKAYASVLGAQKGLEDYFRFYNGLRPRATVPQPRCSMESLGLWKGSLGSLGSLMEEGVHRKRRPNHWQERRDSHLTRS